MDNAFKTGSLINPAIQQNNEVGKVYASKIGERYIEDNVGALKLAAEYFGTTEGEGDFTVTYASGTMLKITGVPFTPSDENIAFVARIPATGSMEVLNKRNDDITYWTNTIQAISASFAATDHFIVGLYGQKKGFDPATDSNKVVQLNPTPMDFTEYQTLTGSVIFGTDSWFSGSTYANCKGKTQARIHVHYGMGHGVVDVEPNYLYMKLLTTKDVTDTAEQYPEPQLSVTAGQTDIQQNLYKFTPRHWTNTTASITAYTKYYTYFDIDVEGSEGFKFGLSESIGGEHANTTGTLDIYYTMTD